MCSLLAIPSVTTRTVCARACVRALSLLLSSLALLLSLSFGFVKQGHGPGAWEVTTLNEDGVTPRRFAPSLPRSLAPLLALSLSRARARSLSVALARARALTGRLSGWKTALCHEAFSPSLASLQELGSMCAPLKP